MSTAIVVAETTNSLSTEMQALKSAAAEFAEAALSTKTRRLYATAWRQFRGWCERLGRSVLPASAETIVLYITHRSTNADAVSVSTIQIDLAAIRLMHELYSDSLLEDDRRPIPTGSKRVRLVMRGIRRRMGVASKPKRAISINELRKMVGILDMTTHRGARDAVILVLGFASAMRRSELVALDLSDVDETEDGLRVTIRKSKTDQEGEGRVVGLPYGSNPSTCPVRVLRRWLVRAEITVGPVFLTVDRVDRVVMGQRMSTKAVARCVKRAASAVGIPPDNVAGHSLRSGFATSAARAGATERAIARQTGHRSMAVLRRYIRDGELFASDSAAGLVGL